MFSDRGSRFEICDRFIRHFFGDNFRSDSPLADSCKYFRHMLTLDLHHDGSTATESIVGEFSMKLFVAPSHLFFDYGKFPLSHAGGEIDDQSSGTARCDLSTFEHIHPLKSGARFDYHLEVPAACRIKPVTSESDQESRASAAYHRQERALD